MADSIYCDTNVFIDLLDATRPAARQSAELIRRLLEEGSTLHINSDTVTTTFYILTRTRRHDPETLLMLLEKTVSIFTVVSIDNREVTEALRLCRDPDTPFGDYEDALQYVCARKVEARMIVTGDRGFVSPDIEVVRMGE